MTSKGPTPPDAREELRTRAGLLRRGIAFGASIEIPSNPGRQRTTMIRKHSTSAQEPELDPKKAQDGLDEIQEIVVKLFPDAEPEDLVECIGKMRAAVEEDKGADGAGAPAPPIELTQRERELCKKRGVSPAAYARTRNEIRAKSGRRA